MLNKKGTYKPSRDKKLEVRNLVTKAHDLNNAVENRPNKSNIVLKTVDSIIEKRMDNDEVVHENSEETEAATTAKLEIENVPETTSDSSSSMAKRDEDGFLLKANKEKKPVPSVVEEKPKEAVEKNINLPEEKEPVAVVNDKEDKPCIFGNFDAEILNDDNLPTSQAKTTTTTTNLTTTTNVTAMTKPTAAKVVEVNKIEDKEITLEELKVEEDNVKDEQDKDNIIITNKKEEEEEVVGVVVVGDEQVKDIGVKVEDDVQEEVKEERDIVRKEEAVEESVVEMKEGKLMHK